MANITLYKDANFEGESITITEATPDLSELNFSDCVSSIIVDDGDWEFYKDVNYESSYDVIFGKGSYSWVEEYGIPNDDISSLKPLTRWAE